MQRELEGLQRWYESQCDGDWEHTYGIHIGTLDNPGWEVEIDLTDTDLETRSFTPVREDLESSDWIHCRVDDRQFRGYGGVASLERILRTFLDWAQQTSVGSSAPA